MLKSLNHILSLFFIILLFLSKTANLTAQTDNYWSWNFNTPSTLLAGSVVGGAAGPSAIFYNPALIDHDNIASLSISASIVTLQFLKAKNIAGNGIDASSISLKIQPRFFSYVLPTKNKKLGVEIALLSPVYEEIDYNIQHFEVLDIIKRMEGVETYSGYLNYSRKYDDIWGGIGFSYKLSENLYIGASAFGSYKRMKYENVQAAHAYQGVDSVMIDQTLQPAYIVQNSFEEELSYWDASLVIKLGVQYKTKNERISVGANLTLPNIPIIGQADVRKSYQISNVYDNYANSFVGNEIIIQNEENVKTNIKNPFSLALGAQFFTKDKSNFISFTIEYFHEIAPYAIIETSENSIEKLPNYFTNYLGVDAFLPYYYEAKSVINAAVGIKQTVTTDFYIFGGFRTDFTSGPRDNIRLVGNKFKVSQIHMDKYHITVGPVLNINRSEVVTGLQYTFGRNRNMSQVVNFTEPEEYIPSTGQALEAIRINESDAGINGISLFLGITFDLFLPKKAEEKKEQF